MNATVEQNLISKIRMLSPQQVAEVEDFVELLVTKAKKRAALDRLLAMVPALEASGAEPMSEDEIAARAGVFGQVRPHRNGRLMERSLNRRQEWVN